MRSLLRLLLPVAFAVGLGIPAAAQVNLPGSWYVLIHYKNDSSPNPDQERWDDKVWEFQQKGRRLRWSEYPIVVFDDETGRFERRSTGQYARILHYWEPSSGQSADIADGLQVNQRGSKNKTLRGSDAEGWTSSRPTSAASASVITYVEVWRIEGMPGRPVFSREDHLGGAGAESMEGLTQYSATDVKNGGNLIVGTFVRDGTRNGTFQMMRAGKAGGLKSQKTQAEIQRQGFERSVQSSPELRRAARDALGLELNRSGASLPESDLDAIIDEMIAAYSAGVPEKEIEKRVAASVQERYHAYAQTEEGRAAIRERLRTDLAESGTVLTDEQLDEVAKEVVAATGDGADDAEIRRRVSKAVEAEYFGWMQRGVRPDDSARYRLPFDSPAPRKLTQGVGGDAATSTGMGAAGTAGSFSHKGRYKYAFDFAMPVGQPVVAARAGRVVQVADGFTEGGPQRGLAGKANVVTVAHADGTFALYVHLSPGLAVKKGQSVAAGDRLGDSGNTGFTTEPHLHFEVRRAAADGETSSVPVHFEDGSTAGFVPVQGQYYGGDRRSKAE